MTVDPFIEAEEVAGHGATRACRLLEVSRSAYYERKKAVQKAPSSESPTSMPSTSRWPSALTPVATTTARDTTWWSTRPFR